MRGQKGITLVALIITIIVLLILAVVAIASLTEYNILGRADNAVADYNQAAKNEHQELQNYVDYIDSKTNS